MKRIFIIVVLIGAILSGCSSISDLNNIEGKMKSPDYQDDNNNYNNVDESNRIYEEFIELVNENKPFELISHIDEEIDKVSVDRADDMILTFEEVQDIYLSYYQQKFFDPDIAVEILNAANDGLDVGIIERIKNEELKELTEEVFKGGYKLVSREGSIYSSADYSFLKKYSQYVSEEVEKYIEIMSTESDKPSAIDGALVISWDELAERMMAIEEITSNNKDFIRNEKLNNMYNNYMRMYLIGIDNTPAYDFQTRVYKDEVIESFNKLINNHKNSETADIVQEYLYILEEKDYIYSENIEEPVLPQVEYRNKMNYKYTLDILAQLLPEKPGYKWVYSGFAEYGHEMTLEDIMQDDERIEYIVKGKVADMSDGESGRDEDYYNIDLTYTIKGGAIVQTKKENMMMDSEMESLELIRAPLVHGNKWMQISIDKSENDRHINRYFNCEITDITQVGDSKVYTVEYRELYSDYYEIRMIEEGVGVVSFEKLWQTDDGNFEIGYGLYKEASGY